jgi:hypothetical protein
MNFRWALASKLVSFCSCHDLSLFHGFHPKGPSLGNNGTSANDGTEIPTVASLSASFGRLCKFYVYCCACVAPDRSAAVSRISDLERVSDRMTTTHFHPFGGQMEYNASIYIDGYISQMFRPEGATAYFARLLNTDTLPIFTNPDWPSMFLISDPQLPHSRPFATIHGQPAWLLDFMIRSVGTVVQQRIWAPQNEGQRHTHAPLNMPIFFTLNDGVTVGLPIFSAATGYFTMLRGASTPAPVGEGYSTLIRINVSANFPCLPC